MAMVASGPAAPPPPPPPPKKDIPSSRNTLVRPKKFKKVASSGDIWDIPSSEDEDDERQNVANVLNNQPPAYPVNTYPQTTTLPSKVSQVAQRIFNSGNPIRPIEQRHPEKVLNLTPRYNLEAILAYERGQEQEEPCGTCSLSNRVPRGPFRLCVVYAGEFDGACCNCRWNNEGSGCTSHRMIAAPNTPRPPRSASAKPRTPPLIIPSRRRTTAIAQAATARTRKLARKAKGTQEELPEADDNDDVDKSS